MQKRSRCTFCREYTVETFVRTRSIGWHMIMQLNAFLTLLLCGPLIPEALLGPLVTPEGDRREHCDTHLPCASCFALATHLHPDQLGKDTACLLAQCSRATAPRSRIKRASRRETYKSFRPFHIRFLIITSIRSCCFGADPLMFVG
jgi:hypothetical protein